MMGPLQDKVQHTANDLHSNDPVTGRGVVTLSPSQALNILVATSQVLGSLANPNIPASL